MGSSFRILVVDDFEPWRRTVSWSLKEHPEWQIVAEASDGVEGVQKAEELQPDLVLLDIGLPKLNGIDAAQAILRIAPNSKILFVSVDICPDLMQAALSTGRAGTQIDREPPRSKAISPHLSVFPSISTYLLASRPYPVRGSVAIRCTILPNSRLVRWPSANSSQ